ncbi:MAG TPA: hypothetical protein VGP99_02020 [Tepidisphaeraceae bacterium]|jgi:hypothetical protein|nr:hypothetical protein [Tepidisphaeraceae bacterium]
MSGRRLIVLVCLACALFGAALAQGAVIIMTPEVLHDLSNGGSVTINNADFVTVDQAPTGSGVIHSFVRVSSANQGVVEGYNTDGRPLQFDENTSATFTRSQKLSDLQIATRNGRDYYQFLLDINQQSSHPLLTLNELEIYLGNAPDLLSYSPNRSGGGTGFGPNASFVYDLDQGTDNAIDLNYNLNSGSGSGDMWAYIPKANFDAAQAGNNNDFVYLYSKFGIPHPNNDGYEEWSGVEGPNNVVPEPSALLAGLFVVAALAIVRIRPAPRLCIASCR